MVSEKIGIGRVVSSKKSQLEEGQEDSLLNLPLTISTDCARTIRMWKYNTRGEYVNNEVFPNTNEPYLHITSPIRRLADLLNQTILLNHWKCLKDTSPESIRFMEKWKTQIDFLNESMRSIRKIQMECDLMDRCFTRPELLETIHSGIVFDKVFIESKQTYQYMVYCEKIQLMTRMVMEKEVDNYSLASFRLFLFENEDKTKKKIRLQYVDPINL
jgi:exoribonuclease R